MGWFGTQRARNRALLIQALIIAGAIGFYKLALPEIQKAQAEAAVAEREQKIAQFVASVVVGAGSSEQGSSPSSQQKGKPSGQEAAGPQHLRRTPEVAEVQQRLGAPQKTMTDFRGGLHLTWIGTRHRLEASFDKGQLYALTITDLQTGHGEQVFESSARWRSF